MNKKISLKYLIVLVVSFFTISGCSFLYEKIDNFAKKLEEKLEHPDVPVIKDGLPTSTLNDVIFYNKYLEAYYKFRKLGDDVYRNYKKDVPTPEAAKNAFMIFVVYNIYLNNLEREIKSFDRSLFDGGDLSKLKANNPNMQQNLESAMRDLLRAGLLFHQNANNAYLYIKENRKTAPINKIKEFDDQFMSGYEIFEESLGMYRKALDESKPTIKTYNPDDFSGNKKAVVTLLNAYVEIMDSTSDFHHAFLDNRITDASDIRTNVNNLRNMFNRNYNNVMQSDFDERHKFMKYNFEDYFKKNYDSYLEKVLKAMNSDDKDPLTNPDKLNLDTQYSILVASYSSGLSIIETMNAL